VERRTVQMEMLGFPTDQQNVVLELERELMHLLFSFQVVIDYHKFDLLDILTPRQMLQLEKTLELEIAFTVFNQTR
jgi:hypothetical protein